jgi:hypothetical protein
LTAALKKFEGVFGEHLGPPIHLRARCRALSRGRSVSNLQFERWEEVFGEPLATLRSRHGLPAEGVTTHGR